MKKNIKSKCACAGAGIGICLCTVFMSISMVSAALVSVSKNAAKSAAGSMASMNGMSVSGMASIKNTTIMSSMQMGTSGNPIIDFFGGFWGEVILLISFGAMIAGVWTSGMSKKLVPIAGAGAAILYASMYLYISIPIEILGSIVIGFAYLSAFSERVAQRIGMT